MAFLDSDVSLKGRIVAGIKVYPPDALAKLIKRQHVSSVLMAIPSTSRRRRLEILKSLEPYPVHVRTVPDISDIVAGHATGRRARRGRQRPADLNKLAAPAFY